MAELVVSLQLRRISPVLFFWPAQRTGSRLHYLRIKRSPSVKQWTWSWTNLNVVPAWGKISVTSSQGCLICPIRWFRRTRQSSQFSSETRMPPSRSHFCLANLAFTLILFVSRRCHYIGRAFAFSSTPGIPVRILIDLSTRYGRNSIV